MTQHVLIELGIIVILGIASQWVAWRLHLPSIFLLLIAGFLAGPVFGLVNPDELMGELLFPFVSISVAIILFEGGLTLNVKELKEIGGVVLSLVMLGVLVTWITASVAAYYLLGLNFEVSILLAAILTVTGPTVIGPLLRQIKPSGRVANILKWEGIVIDPIGALLAVLVFEAILAGGIQGATTTVLLSLGKTVLFGSLSGALFAYILLFLLKRFLIPDFLQESMTLSLVVGAYLVSDTLQHESGLFATTLMGIIIANQKTVSIKHIVEFKENLRVLIISVLFIVLSARLELEVFTSLSKGFIAFLAVLIFISRPLSVFLSTFNSSLTIKEKTFLSWMAPRGIVAAAVSSLFALRLAEVGIENAEFLGPMTFAVIVGTVAVYGLSANPVARALGLSQSNPQGVLFLGAQPLVRMMAQELMKHGFSTVVVDSNRNDIQAAEDRKIPSVHGNMLSDHVIDEIPFQGLGKVMAMTPNEEANSLAMFHFKEVFDREEMYQLPQQSEEGIEPRQQLPNHFKGRTIFGKNISIDDLSYMCFRGATVESIAITKEFSYEDFKEKYRESAIPMFIVTRDKKLVVNTLDRKFDPKPGHLIVTLLSKVNIL